MFGPMSGKIPGYDEPGQFMELLRKLTPPGAGFNQDATVGGPFVPGYGTAARVAKPDWSVGGPNAVNNGFVAKIASGNPGGFLGALMKRANAPVNPGAPPPPGSPAYVPGGEGPAAPAGGGGLTDLIPPLDAGGKGLMSLLGGGDMSGIGMLSKLFGGGMGQFGGGSGAQRFNPGDLMGH